MAWSEAARRAAALARKARKQYKPEMKGLRMVASRSAIQGYRDKLWKKSLEKDGARGRVQPHLRRPKWAMRASLRRKY